jgi:chloride channel 3/4/5
MMHSSFRIPLLKILLIKVPTSTVFRALLFYFCISKNIDIFFVGIRVWYSSFSSIDWLHDAIKDSLRRSRLRKRKSIRSQIRMALDRSIGWIIVTIVGVLTAFTAYAVLQGEQWLFTLKEGYCTTRWWMNLAQCCPNPPIAENPFGSEFEDEYCSAWRTWGHTFGPEGVGFTNEFIEYIVYACIAVIMVITVHYCLPLLIVQ